MTVAAYWEFSKRGQSEGGNESETAITEDSRYDWL